MSIEILKTFINRSILVVYMDVGGIVEWFKSVFSSFYTKFILAIITLFFGVIIGRFAGKLLHRILNELEIDRIIKKTTVIKFSVEEVISSFFTYSIYFVTIIMALNQLGITTTVLEIIVIIILLIIVLSILLGVRDFIPNIISGVFICQKRFLKEGDKVKIGDVEGEIVKVSLTETMIRTKSDDMIYMPNSILTKKEVIKLKK